MHPSLKRTLSAQSGGSAAGGWDLTGWSYTGNSYSLTSGHQNTYGINVVDSGSKAITVSSDSAGIEYHTLTTPYDISTGSYTGTISSWGSQDGSAVDIFTRPDGTRVYMGGDNNERVFQYNLSTPFTNGSYSGNSFSVSGQAGDIRCITLSEDGTKLYVGKNAVHQYTLSTAWDITSASYDSKTLSGITDGLAISPDGAKFFVMKGGDRVIKQYTLTTPYDISTAVDDSVDLDFSAQLTNYPFSFGFSDDGQNLYIGDLSDDDLFQYSE